jgi:hypothetical protein
MRLWLKNTLYVLMALCVGCASLHQGDIHAQAPKIGTDGYYFVVNGKKMNHREAQTFFSASGANEASAHLEQGIQAYSRGGRWLFKDALIGGLLIAIPGMLGAVAQPQGNPGQGVGIASAFSAFVGFLVGIPHSYFARQKALPEIQAAAGAYNRALDAGTLKPVPEKE